MYTSPGARLEVQNEIYLVLSRSDTHYSRSNTRHLVLMSLIIMR
jgi:hypothetical protein